MEECRPDASTYKNTRCKVKKKKRCSRKSFCVASRTKPNQVGLHLTKPQMSSCNNTDCTALFVTLTTPKTSEEGAERIKELALRILGISWTEAPSELITAYFFSALLFCLFLGFIRDSYFSNWMTSWCITISGFERLFDGNLLVFLQSGVCPLHVLVRCFSTGCNWRESHVKFSPWCFSLVRTDPCSLSSHLIRFVCYFWGGGRRVGGVN